jgi:hypothetical protein
MPTAVSTSASLTINGGLKRSDDSPHSSVRSPRRNASSWTASATWWTAELDADHETLTADVAHHVAGGGRPLDARPQVRPHRRGVGHPLDSMTSSVARPAAAQTGLPAKVDPWAPGGQVQTDSRAMNAPIGIPEAIPLAVVHDVRLDAGVLDRPPSAGAAHARLDLVGDEEDAVLVADLAQSLHEGLRRGEVAALSLDRLDDDGGHVGGRDLRPKIVA